MFPDIAFGWYLFFFLAAASSFLLTRSIRGRTLRLGLLDVPNARSSHVVPVPRGGGLAIVSVFLSGLPVLVWCDALSVREMIAFLGAGILVAAVGAADDFAHISVRWRLLAHFVAVSWGLAWMGGVPPAVLPDFLAGAGWGGQILAVVALVWLLNLYNFMDGIDGLAGGEAIATCGGGVLLYALMLPSVAAWMAPMLLFAAVLGFLCWNFPPAKIFMGDAGSGFLGLALGLLAIQAAWAASAFFWGWLILLGVFIVDASVTLLVRIVRGERIYQAHRSHAYQFAARKHGSHKTVTLAVGAVNLFWLLPLALLVGRGALDGVRGLLVAYLPLVVLAFYYKAGALEKRAVEPP